MHTYVLNDDLFTFEIERFWISEVKEDIQHINWVGDIKKLVEDRKIVVRATTNFSALLFNSIDRWVDIEAIYYQELKKYLNEQNIVVTPNSISKEEKFKQLNKQLRFLRNKLEHYLSIEYKSKSITHKIPDSFFIRHLQGKYTTGRLNEANLYFLNFNYTHTTDIYFQNNLTNKTVGINHIHGQLNKQDNPIIFGFGDEKDKAYQKIEDLEINEAFKFIKSFGYFHAPNYKQLLSFIDSDKFDVSIMGHSCGLSDRTMLSTIFEHNNCNSIRICYYRPKPEYMDRTDYTEKTYNISRLFDDKAAFRRKILDFDDNDRIPQHNDKL